MESRNKETTPETDSFLITKAEKGKIPDLLFRYGVCKMLHNTCKVDLAPGGYQHYTTGDFVERIMRAEEDTNIQADKAKEQQYEVPASAFELFLGDYLKYSCSYWYELEYHDVSPEPSKSFYRDVVTGTSSMTKEFEKGKSIRQLLTTAEINMMRVAMARMELKDGYNVLDAGCGWGSATMYILENYTKSKVVAIANSDSQREFIEIKAKDKGLKDRLLVITCDINSFTRERYGKQIENFLGKPRFERIYSCEMLEQVKNWEQFLNKLRDDWADDETGLFLQFLSHKDRAYPFDTKTWIGKYFLTGRIMPSHNLIKSLDRTIGRSWEIAAEYKVNGRHYAKTCEAWLKLFDQESKRILKIFEETYKGKEEGKIWFNRWRMYYITMAEMFGFREGTEWFVSNYFLKAVKNNS